jgi:pimeloyl-ACP methyl ester carboxylesterase
MLPLAVPFHTAGLNVLLLDARNHGRSDSASFSSLPRFAEDIGAAINWVKTRNAAPADRIALLGHSVGAGAALLEASRRNDISAVISISAFAHPEWMMRRYLARLRIPRFVATWIIRYVELVIAHRYDDIAPMNTACQVTCPVLLVHGKADTTVPVTDAITIHDNCDGNCPELILMDAVGHSSVETVHEHVHDLLAFLRGARMISE